MSSTQVNSQDDISKLYNSLNDQLTTLGVKEGKIVINNKEYGVKELKSEKKGELNTLFSTAVQLKDAVNKVSQPIYELSDIQSKLETVVSLKDNYKIEQSTWNPFKWIARFIRDLFTSTPRIYIDSVLEKSDLTKINEKIAQLKISAPIDRSQISLEQRRIIKLQIDNGQQQEALSSFNESEITEATLEYIPDDLRCIHTIQSKLSDLKGKLEGESFYLLWTDAQNMLKYTEVTEKGLEKTESLHFDPKTSSWKNPENKVIFTIKEKSLTYSQSLASGVDKYNSYLQKAEEQIHGERNVFYVGSSRKEIQSSVDTIRQSTAVVQNVKAIRAVFFEENQWIVATLEKGSDKFTFKNLEEKDLLSLGKGKRSLNDILGDSSSYMTIGGYEKDNADYVKQCRQKNAEVINAFAQSAPYKTSPENNLKRLAASLNAGAAGAYSVQLAGGVGAWLKGFIFTVDKAPTLSYVDANGVIKSGKMYPTVSGIKVVFGPGDEQAFKTIDELAKSLNLLNDVQLLEQASQKKEAEIQKAVTAITRFTSSTVNTASEKTRLEEYSQKLRSHAHGGVVVWKNDTAEANFAQYSMAVLKENEWDQGSLPIIVKYELDLRTKPGMIIVKEGSQVISEIEASKFNNEVLMKELKLSAKLQTAAELDTKIGLYNDCWVDISKQSGKKIKNPKTDLVRFKNVVKDESVGTFALDYNENKEGIPGLITVYYIAKHSAESDELEIKSIKLNLNKVPGKIYIGDQEYRNFSEVRKKFDLKKSAHETNKQYWNLQEKSRQFRANPFYVRDCDSAETANDYFETLFRELDQYNQIDGSEPASQKAGSPTRVSWLIRPSSNKDTGMFAGIQDKINAWLPRFIQWNREQIEYTISLGFRDNDGEMHVYEGAFSIQLSKKNTQFLYENKTYDSIEEVVREIVREHIDLQKLPTISEIKDYSYSELKRELAELEGEASQVTTAEKTSVTSENIILQNALPRQTARRDQQNVQKPVPLQVNESKKVQASEPQQIQKVIIGDAKKFWEVYAQGDISNCELTDSFLKEMGKKHSDVIPVTEGSYAATREQILILARREEKNIPETAFDNKVPEENVEVSDTQDVDNDDEVDDDGSEFDELADAGRPWAKAKIRLKPRVQNEIFNQIINASDAELQQLLKPSSQKNTQCFVGQLGRVFADDDPRFDEGMTLIRDIYDNPSEDSHQVLANILRCARANNARLYTEIVDYLEGHRDSVDQ